MALVDPRDSRLVPDILGAQRAGLQLQQARELAPIKLQQEQLGLEQEQAQQVSQLDQSTLDALISGANQLKGITSPEGKISFLQQQKERFTQAGLPTQGIDDALSLAQQGNFEELAVQTDRLINLGLQQAGKGVTGIQQAVSVPGVGFAGLTRQGVAKLIELPEEDQVKVQEALKTEAERKATEAGLKTTAKLEAELVGKPAIEAAITEATGEAEVQTPLGKIKLREATVEQIQEAKDLATKKSLINTDADAAISNIDQLLKGDLFKRIYGAVEGRTPTITQESINAEALRDQVVSLLQLESRQKLKGQGAITEGETKTLERSVGVLSNPLISDSLAKDELNRIKKIFESAKKRANEGNFIVPTETTAPVTPAAQPQQTFQEGQTATNPQTGQKLIFRSGQWEAI